MCGIVGIGHSDSQRPVAREAIEKMCQAIAHRGPDGQGVWVDGPVGIGMRRLSIIDLHTGDQPIFNEDRSLAIVFNGEIYNYRELRRDLLASGHRLATESDTETILHLFEKHGPSCLTQLRGMFAFAIWDRRRRRLTLARDRFGIKPLYWSETDAGIVFASELKALVSTGMVERTLDRAAVDAYLQLGYIPAPATPLSGVHKLEPGCLLEWDVGSRPSITRYWDLPVAAATHPEPSVDELLEWIDDSVRAHMVSDVPVAAFLSGGMDSSAVVSSMARETMAPHAFTVRYAGSDADRADETPLAAALGKACSADVSIVTVHPNVDELIEPIVHALDEPLADESAIPTWLISEAVAQTYKVALVGTGGDELFGGYRRYRAMLIGEYYHHVPTPIRSAIARSIAKIPEPSGADLRLHRMKRFLASNGNSRATRYLDYFTKCSDADRAKLWASPPNTGNLAEERFTNHFATAHDAPTLRGTLYVDYKTYLPDDLLAVSDRISMAHSLETRVPFVDHRLIEQAFPIPDSSRINVWRGQGKEILRRALRQRLPPQHFRAPKRGFVGPTAAWLRNELRTILSDELASDRVRRLGLFDSQQVQQLLRDHLERRHNREGILWALLCFMVWHRTFLE